MFVVSHVRQWRRCGDFAEASPSVLEAASAALSKIRVECGGAMLEWKEPRVTPQKLVQIHAALRAHLGLSALDYDAAAKLSPPMQVRPALSVLLPASSFRLTAP